MLVVEMTADLEGYVGKLLGTSDWMRIDQQMIDAFGKLTGDDNWIHMDEERAKREMPEGRTIAHGLLTLSLVTHLGSTICTVKRRLKSVNYGSDRVRFTAPVKCGSRVRLHRTLKEYKQLEGGARLTYHNVVEIEGEERPALLADTISVSYDEAPKSN